jgi:MinD-like ATPase involved in chromosome partitioning or flagellar assembly
VAGGARFLTARLLVESDAAGVRVIGLVGSDADRRHAASVGLHELVDAGCPWSDLEAMIAGPAPGSAAPPRPERGSVIAVWGPAGAPGRTTLAISITAEIAAAGFSVALVDADTYSGSVGPALGLLDESPGFAAACRLAGANGLDRGELERIGQRYLSGHGSFWVLTGIGRPSRWPELSAERVVATVRECTNWVDFTVIDTGFSLENDEEISSDLFAPRRNAATISALREADQIVAVGSADPVGLSRFLRAHVDLIEAIVTDRVTVVMNRVRASAIGLNPARQVTQTLSRFGGIASPVLIPYDQAALDAAVLTGRTLRDVAVRSPARIAIGQFVESRILPQTGARAKTRRASRARPAAALG